MTYLLLQMLLALSLAALFGGAIGWLIHRATHSTRVLELRQALGRAHSQLKQAQSEIAMLSDDYDDMHRRTQEEMEVLRQENQQIPFLNTNLEKSQLLVRQMMQKHEAKVRDLNSENQTLSARLKSIEDREQAHNTVQAELDRRRREKKRQAEQSTEQTDLSANTELTDANGDRADPVLSPHRVSDPNTSPESGTDDTLGHSTVSDEQSAVSTQSRISNARPSGSWASVPLVSDTLSDTHDIKTIDIDTDADPFDHVMEVGDDLQRELSEAAPDTTD